MIDLRDDYFHQAENDYVQIAICSVLGNRKEQQDRAGYDLVADSAIIAVCNGMGGHSGGKQASVTAVEKLLQNWNAKNEEVTPQSFLVCNVFELDRTVASGTTLSAVILEKNQLHWVSVGDSRIYISRKPEFVRITKDHTYYALQQAGQLPQNLPKVQNPESVLVSFIGVGNVSRIERNRVPMDLQSGDCVLLISDGLYKLLNDHEMNVIISQYQDVADIAQALIHTAQDRARDERISADNITVAIAKIK